MGAVSGLILLYEDLCGLYGEQVAGVLLLLKVYTIIHPLLYRLEIASEPLAVILPPKVSESEIKRLMAGHVAEEIYSTDNGLKEIRKSLSKDKEVLLYRCQNGSNTLKTIELLQIATHQKEIAGAEVYGLPVVLYSAHVPTDHVEHFLGQVSLLDMQPGKQMKLFYSISCTEEVIKYIVRKFPIVEHERWKVREYEDEKYLTCEGFLLAYILLCMMLDGVTDKKTAKSYKTSLRKSLDLIVDGWFFDRLDLDWAKMMRKMLLANASNFSQVIDMEDTSPEDLQRIETALSYNSKAYFVSRRKFEDLCAPSTKTVGIQEVRRGLAEASVLIKESRKATEYTSKAVWESQGVILRTQRQYKLDKNMLDPPGMLTIKEIFEAKQVEQDTGLTLTLGFTEGIEREIKVSSKTDNQHLTILGRSGSGKSVASQCVMRRLAMDGGLVIGFNYGNTQTKWEVEASVQYFDILQGGIPLSLFERGADVVDSIVSENIVNLFASLERMGEKQKAMFRKACKEARNKLSAKENEMIEFCDSLVQDDEGLKLVSKFSTWISLLRFSGDESWMKTPGIYIMDFSDYDSTTQMTLTGIVLQILWSRMSRLDATKHLPTWLVLDEIRDLDDRGDGILREILLKGRKFNLSTILITQSLQGIPKGVRACFRQAATTLFLGPSEEDLELWADELSNISGMKPKQAKELLANLDVGECIATGKFAVIKDHKKKSIKMKFKI